MRNRRYWFKLLRLFLVALIFVVILIPFLLGASLMLFLTRSGCNRSADPSWFNPAYETVTFPTTDNLEIEGYFIPGDEDATIIIVPAMHSDKGSHLDYGNIYNQAGFNVLTFDARTCAGAKSHSLGYKEVDDVEAAYAYLRTRDDVDPMRIGLHGFSSAGATSMMAAGRIPEIRSVTAIGGYHDFNALVQPENLDIYLPQLFSFGASLAYRIRVGESITHLSPINALDEIAPRPLLLIYGNRESSLAGARQMLARSEEVGGNTDLWIVDEAGHGEYLLVAREEFAQRAVRFHRAALLGDVGDDDDTTN